MHKFGRAAGSKVKTADLSEVAGFHACLFTDFTRGASFGRFARLEGAGGQLEHFQPGGMTILAHKINPSLFVHRNEADGAMMVNNIVLDSAAIGSAQIV